MKPLFLVFSILLSATSVLSQRDVNSVSDKLFDLRMQHKYDEAIVDLDSLIEANPNDAKLYIKRAEFWKLQNNLDKAFADLDKAIDLASGDAMFYIERAKYFNLAKNNQGVLRDVKTAVSIAPDTQYILIYGAKELAFGGQYEEIIKITDSYIARNELSYWAYKIRGENKFALKNYVGALEDSIKSIELITFTGDKNKDFSTNIELSNLPQFNIIYSILGKYLKDDKKVFDYYNQVFDVLGSKVAESVKYHQKDDYYQRLKPGQSMVIHEINKLRALMIQCAELYAEKGQPDKGVELFDRIIKLEFQPAGQWIGYAYRADFYKKIGKYQKAIDDLTFVNSGRERPFVDILIRRADLYFLTKKYDEAITDYEAAKTIDKRIETRMNEKISASRQKILERAMQPK